MIAVRINQVHVKISEIQVESGLTLREILEKNGIDTSTYNVIDEHKSFDDVINSNIQILVINELSSITYNNLNVDSECYKIGTILHLVSSDHEEGNETHGIYEVMQEFNMHTLIREFKQIDKGYYKTFIKWVTKRQIIREINYQEKNIEWIFRNCESDEELLSEHKSLISYNKRKKLEKEAADRRVPVEW